MLLHYSLVLEANSMLLVLLPVCCCSLQLLQPGIFFRVLRLGFLRWERGWYLLIRRWQWGLLRWRGFWCLTGGRYCNFFYWLGCILCCDRTLFVSWQMHFCPLLQTKQVLSIPVLLLFLWSHLRRIWLRGSLMLFSILVLGTTLQRLLLDSCLSPRSGGRWWSS